MLKAITSIVKPMDVLIALAGIYIFYTMDYANMETIDWIFAVSFGSWFVLLVVRFVLVLRKS